MDVVLKAGGLLLLFASVFAFIYALLPGEKEQKARKQFEEKVEPGEATGFINMFRPFFSFFRPLAVRLAWPGYQRRIQKMLVNAGLDRELNVSDFVSFQFLLLVLFFLMGLVLWKTLGSAFSMSLVGLVYPYFWLWDKKRSRQRDIALAMPDVVDMLSLSVEAGLDMLAGIKRICDVSTDSKDPFIQELGYMYHNIKLGMSTEEALNVMADRVDVQEVYSFTSILIQAQKMGSSISEVLKSQAVRMRQQRFMKAERAGAVASQKLLVPMMLCILPVLFIVIFAPYVLKYIYGQ